MAKIKVSKLTSSALDWAVAKCEDVLERIELEQVNGTWAVAVPDLGCYFEPAACWTQGGPIIERENISVQARDGVWSASVKMPDGSWPIWGYGQTPLIAAMRCFVASKLGDTVEIPDDII